MKNIAAFPVIASLCFAAANANGQPADFYAGKTISLIISSGEGGTNDAYARLIASHIGKHIPGGPTVVPRNMPGAGGVRAANFLHDVAPKDGTAIGVVQRGIILQPLVDIKTATFKPQNFNWIGSTAREVSVGVVWLANTKVRKIDDAKAIEVIVGSSGVGNDTGAFPLVLNTFIGTKFKPVHGYKSGSEITLAMERGEVQGRVGWSWGSVKSRSQQWLTDRKIAVIVQMGLEPAPDLPDVPNVLDLVSSEEDKAALNLIFAPTFIGWPTLMPPNVPPELVAIVRAAYKKALEDPALVAAAKKQDLELDPLDGEQIQKIVARLYSYPREVIERARVGMTAGQ
ncbi:MAG: Bug family tripartite tricarboxylate transporter substrate binding protein [Beijerinckiaceae bacterium]